MEDEEVYEQICTKLRNDELALTCTHVTRDDFPRNSRLVYQFGLVIIDDDENSDLTLNIGFVGDDHGSDERRLHLSLVYYVCHKRLDNSTPQSHHCTYRDQENIFLDLGVILQSSVPFTTRLFELRSWAELSAENNFHVALANEDCYGFEDGASELQGRVTPEQVAHAFGARRGKDVHSVRVPIEPFSRTNISARFLPDLCSHPRLKELIVRNCTRYDTRMPEMRMVAKLLFARNSFQHLLLYGFKLNVRSLACLVRALQHENCSVTKVTLATCSYSAEDDLIRFVQSISPPNSTVREIHIADLHKQRREPDIQIDASDSDDDDDINFDYNDNANDNNNGDFNDNGDDVNNLFDDNNNNNDDDHRESDRDSTVGSVVARMMIGAGLEALSLEGPAGDVDFDSFCQTLVDNASRIEFSRLALYGFGGGVNTLARWLPNLSFLKTLNWYDSVHNPSWPDLEKEKVPEDQSRMFLRALCQNKSLIHVTVETDMGYDENLIRAYCQRNVQFPLLMAENPVSLFPLLFALARQQAPLSASNDLFICLLSAFDSCGPNRSQDA